MNEKDIDPERTNLDRDPDQASSRESRDLSEQTGDDGLETMAGNRSPPPAESVDPSAASDVTQEFLGSTRTPDSDQTAKHLSNDPSTGQEPGGTESKTQGFGPEPTFDHLPGHQATPGEEATGDFQSVDDATMDHQQRVIQKSKKKKKAPSAVGKTIGEYEITAELGRGGMGVVYRGRHKKLKRDVALKMILAGEHTSQESIDRFLIEARAVAHLQHPNIVQIFDIGDHEGLPFFSLEFVEGTSLAESSSDETMSAKAAAQVIMTLSDALQYAHDEGIVHRDIKPANILIAKDGTPKISDFGLAKDIADESGSTRTGDIMGTPSYMSPEQAKGMAKELGPTTDQYSLGAMLYRLITGRPPFAAAKPFETVMQVIKNEPLPPRQLQPEIPVDLETICLKTLEKDPAGRYESCAELSADLRRFLNNEPITARPVGNAERLWRWCKRNPRLAAVSGTALSLLLTVAVVSTWAYFALASQTEIIKKQKDRAEDLTEIAEAKTKIALDQARNSLTTIQDTLTRVNEKLAVDPKFDELRLDIATNLLDSLSRVDSSILDDERGEATPTLMAINQQLTELFRKQGHWDKALETVKQNYEMAQDRLVVKKYNDASRMNMSRLCTTYSQIIDSKEGDSEATQAKMDEALTWVRQIVADPRPEADNADSPKQHQIQSLLGAILQDCGAQRYKVGKLEEFNQLFSEAADVFRNWLTTFPESEEFQAEPADFQKTAINDVRGSLSRIRLGLATYQFKTQEFDEAFQNFDELVVEYQAKLDVESPQPMERVNYTQFAGRIGFDKLKVVANGLDTGGKYRASATDLLTKADDVAQALAEEYDKSADLKFIYSLSQYRLGTLREELDQMELAQPLYQKSRDLRAELVEQSPDNSRYSNMLMVAEARSCDWESAQEMADKKAAAQPDAPQLVILARAYALCSRCEGAPAKELQTKAIESLKLGLEKGYSDWFELQYEPDLKPIRDLPSFVDLIATIKDSGD